MRFLWACAESGGPTGLLRLLPHQEHVAAGLGGAALRFERDGERVGRGRRVFLQFFDYEEQIARGFAKVKDAG